MGRAAYNPRVGLFAKVLVGATLFLILAGAMVTSTGSGLAVPDWPLSFGKFFPEMTGGVFYEHGHRMVAGTVGILTLVLAAWLQLVEKRSWVRRLGWTALGAVVAQALLGGLTVLMNLPTQVSVAHAGLAQLFLGLTVALALATSRDWMEAGRKKPGYGIPALAAWTTGALYLQVLLGAVTRHSGAGLAIPDFPLSFGRVFPPDWTGPVLIHFLHRTWAYGVTGLVLLAAHRILDRHPGEGALARPALAMGLLVLVQFLLGVLVIFSRKSVVPTSLHVVTGAALFACSVALTLNARHHLKP